MPLSFGFSFCPNDTYIFYALSKGLTSLGALDVVMADVEELNRKVLDGALDVSKVSAGLLPEIEGRYVLLSCGGAFSQEAPVVVSREKLTVDDVRELAIPGKHTTAYLLYRKLVGEPERVVELRYDEVMKAVVEGRVQAGILIHEGRFTYGSHGLHLVVDLGKLWSERFKGVPVPLGVVVLRKELEHLKETVERAIRESISYAVEHESEVMPFVKEHAQELSNEVIRNHIDVFVNEFTFNLGEEGKRALEFLFG